MGYLKEASDRDGSISNRLSNIGKPKQPTITVCTLSKDEYQKQLFRSGDRLVSSVFPNLQLTAKRVFAAG